METELKDKLSDALSNSVEDSFSTIFAMDLNEAEQAAQEGDLGSVLCSIGMVGAVEGSITVALNIDVACKLVSKMLGDELSELTPDVLDGCCEIANLVAGGLKNRIATPDLNFEISVPTVVHGQGLHIANNASLSRVEKYFECDDIAFSTVLSYKFQA